jgi:hypothetical protein
VELELVDLVLELEELVELEQFRLHKLRTFQLLKLWLM